MEIKDSSNLKLYQWIARLVFSIDKKTVAFWLTLNGLLCILPAKNFGDHCWIFKYRCWGL